MFEVDDAMRGQVPKPNRGMIDSFAFLRPNETKTKDGIKGRRRRRKNQRDDLPQ